MDEIFGGQFMNIVTKCAVASAVALAVSQILHAGTAPYFVPLTEAETVEYPNSVDELNKPWTVPLGVKQTNLTSMDEIESDIGQSIVRVDAGRNSSMWDMLGYDPSGEFIFIPHETSFGAGVSRYDVANDRSEVLFKGDSSGAISDAGFNSDNDFGAFDPVRWTSNGTLITGEEWSGTGRLVEICNPLGDAPADPTASALKQGDCKRDASAQWRVLDGLPLSAHEGIAFSLKYPQKVMYFVDEDNTGSIYKTIFTKPGYYNKGQTFVLKVKGFAGDVSKNWNDPVNADQTRTGKALWVPITNRYGKPLPGVQDPTENILDANGDIVDAGYAGRLAADDVGGTPYGRPEDATIGISKYGNELIYVATTSENSVYSIEETKWGPYVRVFVSGDTPKNVGFKNTNAVLNSPDNLAIDALGNVYVIEDSPNTGTVGADGGDIWFARDMNSDGVAESLDHFMSLQVNRSEATGMIFHPVDPTKFVVAVQHPQSTDLAAVPGGFGDALWEFDLKHVQPPACEDSHRISRDMYDHYYNHKQWYKWNKYTYNWVKSCSEQEDFNFIEALINSERPNDFPKP